MPDLIQDCDTVLAANPGAKRHASENRVNFAEGLQGTERIFFPCGQKYGRARRMVGMIGGKTGISTELSKNRLKKDCQADAGNVPRGNGE